MSFSTFNAGVLGTSRHTYALGREGTLPRFLGKIHRGYFTPRTSLLFLYAIAVLMVFIITYTRSFSMPLYVAAGFNPFMYIVLFTRGLNFLLGINYWVMSYASRTREEPHPADKIMTLLFEPPTLKIGGTRARSFDMRK
jgi:amino acid transporter